MSNIIESHELRKNLSEFTQAPIGSVVARDLQLPQWLRPLGLVHVAIKVSPIHVIDMNTTGIKLRNARSFFPAGTQYRGTRWGRINTTPDLTVQTAWRILKLYREGKYVMKYHLLSTNCQYFCLCCVYGRIVPGHIDADKCPSIPPFIDRFTTGACDD